MSTKVVGGLIAVVLLAAVAVGAVTLLGDTADPDRALALVPPEAVGYSDVVLGPGLLQRREIGALVVRFGLADDPQEAVDRALQALLDPLGLDYVTQVEPWLGDVAAAFALGDGGQARPSGALLVATTDPQAAEAAVRAAEPQPTGEWEPRRHRETEYFVADGRAYGFVADFLVVGDERALQATVEAHDDGESLAQDDRVRGALGELGGDPLVRTVVDGAAAGEVFADGFSLGMMPGIPGNAAGLTAAGMSVTADTIVLDVVTADAGEAGRSFAVGRDALAGLPASSFFALALPPLGPLLEGMLDALGEVPMLGAGSTFVEEGFRAETGLDLREDVLRWMGTGSVFARGDSLLDLSGGLVVESDDPPATAAFVDAIAALLAESGAPLQPVERAGLRGFALQEFGIPAPVELLGGERLVLGYGDAAGAFGTTQLSGDERFDRARGDLPSDYSPVLYIDLVAARSFGENVAQELAGSLPPEYTEQVRPNLEPLRTVIAGTRTDDDWSRQRVVLRVGEGS